MERVTTRPESPITRISWVPHCHDDIITGADAAHEACLQTTSRTRRHQEEGGCQWQSSLHGTWYCASAPFQVARMAHFERRHVDELQEDVETSHVSLPFSSAVHVRCGHLF